jgi:hypothetical protein
MKVVSINEAVSHIKEGAKEEVNMTNNKYRNRAAGFVEGFEAFMRCSPFEARERGLYSSLFDDWSISDFFDKDKGLYVNPSDYKTPDFLAENSPRFEPERKDSLYYLNHEWNKFLGDKDDFQEMVEKTSQPDLMTIQGYAGTGKTTYLQYLKNKYENSSLLNFHIITLDDPIEAASLDRNPVDCTKLIKMNYAVGSVTTHLIRYIFELLSNEYSGKELDKYDPIATSSYFSKEFFGWSLSKNRSLRDEVNDFYHTLGNYSSGKHITNADELWKKVSQYFKEVIVSIDEPETALYVVFQIAFSLIINLNKKHKGRRYILAIDNFEELLKIINPGINDGIRQNDDDGEFITANISDINIIVEQANKALSKFREYSTREPRAIEPTAFSVIFVFRESTYMSASLQTHRHKNHNYNLNSTSILLDEIIKKRNKGYESYFDESIIPDSDKKKIEFFKNVLFDKTTSQWCMFSVLLSLNNYNLRNTITSLFTIISPLGPNGLKTLLEVWESANNNLRKRTQKEKSDREKHLMRKRFINMILLEYERNGFLQSVMPIKHPLDDINERNIDNYANIFSKTVRYGEFSFYSRKILNICRNHQLVSNDVNNEGIDMLDLFALLVFNNLKTGKEYLFENYPDSKSLCLLIDMPYARKVDEFVDKVLTMSNHIMEIGYKYHAYGRLLDVNLPNSGSLSRESLEDHLVSALTNKCGSNGKIKLTPAGEQFVFLIPDMEMYYARHLAAQPSLFSTYARSKLDSYCSQYGDTFKLEKMPHYIFLKAKEVIEASLLDDYLCFEYGYGRNRKLIGDDYGHTRNPCPETISYHTALIRDDGSYKFEPLSFRILDLHMNSLNDYVFHMDESELFSEEYQEGGRHFHATQAVQRALARYYVLYDDLSNDLYNIYRCNSNSANRKKLWNTNMSFTERYGQIFVICKQHPGNIHSDLMSCGFNIVEPKFSFKKIFHGCNIYKNNLMKLDNHHIYEVRKG